MRGSEGSTDPTVGLRREGDSINICQSVACVADWTGRNAATITACMALLLTIWGVLTSRLTARMAALPLLHTFQRTTSEEVTVDIVMSRVDVEWLGDLVNGGLGPAIVTKYELSIDGVVIDFSNKPQTGQALAAVFAQRPEDVTAEWFDLLQGAIAISKDAKIPCFSVKFSVPTLEHVNRLPDGFQRLALRVEYQSMYGDQLLFESERAPLPPQLSLFWKHRRKRR
jgi:hypothetical protein